MNVIEARGLRKEFTVRIKAGAIRRQKRVVAAVDTRPRFLRSRAVAPRRGATAPALLEEEESDRRHADEQEDEDGRPPHPPGL